MIKKFRNKVKDLELSNENKYQSLDINSLLGCITQKNIIIKKQEEAIEYLKQELYNLKNNSDVEPNSNTDSIKNKKINNLIGEEKVKHEKKLNLLKEVLKGE